MSVSLQSHIGGRGMVAKSYGLANFPILNLSSQVPSSIPAGTEAVLSGLPCGWRNRPEHTCIVQTRLSTTGLIKDEFRKPRLRGCGSGGGWAWTKTTTPILDNLLLWILHDLSHFPSLVWIIKRSQYLNIFSQSWFGFCFLWTNRGMWATKYELFCVWYHHILILSTQVSVWWLELLLAELCRNANLKFWAPGCSESSQSRMLFSDFICPNGQIV